MKIDINKLPSYEDWFQEQMKDPEFRAEWEKSEPIYQAGRQLIQARIDKKMSQRDLAKKAKTTQAVVSRVESLSLNPSLGLLQKLAVALDKKLEVNFR